MSHGMATPLSPLHHCLILDSRRHNSETFEFPYSIKDDLIQLVLAVTPIVFEWC